MDAHKLARLNEIEEAIKNRLSTGLADLEVRVNAGDGDGRATLNKDILIIYRGSNFKRPTVDFNFRQKRELQWQITLQLKDLRSHKQSYPVEEACLVLLTGFAPHECLDGQLFPIATELQARDEKGYFNLQMLFGLRSDWL